MSVVRDPALSGLPGALDVERTRELLRAAIPECREGLELEKLKIHDVQYRPGESCVIHYAAKLRREETSRSETQWLSAILLPDGRSPETPPEELVARYRASSDRALHDPVIRIPDAGLHVYVFPFDPGILSLVDACDPATMKRKLGRLWKKRGVRLRRVTVHPLGYTPRARAALHYETLSEARDSHLPETRHLVGKIDVNRCASDLFAKNWAVWKQAAQRFELAPPVGYVPDLNLALQERVEGPRLSELAGNAGFLKTVRQTARAAAILHSLELPLRFRRPFEQKAKAVRRWGGMLAAIRPGEAGRIHELGERLAAELERRATITGSVHGDLHPSNVLVADGRVILIDLDNMTLGDRLLDVGRFLSALRTSALREFGSATALAPEGEAFLEHYLSHTGEDESRARLFEATSLMITAGTGFRLQRPGWEETAEALIDEAERVFRLAGAGTGTGAAPKDAASRSRRHEINASWAEDGQYVRAVLDADLRRVYEAEATECTVERKRGTARHDRFRLHLAGWRGEERWKRTLTGYLLRRRGGARITRRVSRAHEALAGNGKAPKLPLPVAYVGEIGMQVFEIPRGRPLAECLDGPTIDLLARALAAFHSTSIALDKSRPVAEELRTLRSRLDRPSVPAEFATAARSLLDRLSETLQEDPVELCPVFRHLSLRRLLLNGDGIALSEVDDVMLSDPLLDVAEVSGRLVLAGLQRHGPDEGSDLADRFVRAYLARRNDSRERLAAFEAAALLKLACGEVERDAGGPLAGQLLAAAQGRR